mgnify:CR=1 FL=1
MTIKRNGRVYEYNKDSHVIEVFDDKGETADFNFNMFLNANDRR